MKKRSANIFTSVPVRDPKRNLFDLSHEVKMSGKFGVLYPVLCQEVLPNDHFDFNLTSFVRFAPLLAPIMHRVDVKVHFFFVPNRLLVGDLLWQKFITGGQDGATEPVMPYISLKGVCDAPNLTPQLLQLGSVWDYLGGPLLPEAEITTAALQNVSVMPFRAYGKIWNDWYRDPNLQDEIDLDLETEGNLTNSMVASGCMLLQKIGWGKDYLTSCLPWAQRGAEVLMPLAGSGSVTYLPTSLIKTTAGGDPTSLNIVGTGNPGAGVQNLKIKANTADNGASGRIENISSVNITTSSVSMNDFRYANALQKWMETTARAGARYTEVILGHFGVNVPDYRLQRSEYLGGMKKPVVISQVVATANSDNGTSVDPIGTLYGHGSSMGQTGKISYFAPEHGFCMAILSVTPASSYDQGLERMWTRDSKWDYAWPLLAHLGEQEVLKKEAFFKYTGGGEDTYNNGVFGYIPRYAEYKYRQDRLAGDFRDTLGFWTLNRNFTSPPVLDATFVSILEQGVGEETMRRVFAVQDGTDYLWIQLFFHIYAKRALPYFGVPSLVA